MQRSLDRDAGDNIDSYQLSPIGFDLHPEQVFKVWISCMSSSFLSDLNVLIGCIQSKQETLKPDLLYVCLDQALESNPWNIQKL